jgi:hypothetical protein
VNIDGQCKHSPTHMFRSVGPPTGVSGDVGLETFAGTWGCPGRADVLLDVTQDVQPLSLDRTIFGQLPFLEGSGIRPQCARV